MTVVSVLALPVRPGARAVFADRFAELQILERCRRSDGFLGGRLLRPLNDSSPFLVVADWESAEAYQAWLDNPVRAELAAQLEPLLLDEVVAGELFQEA